MGTIPRGEERVLTTISRRKGRVLYPEWRGGKGTIPRVKGREGCYTQTGGEGTISGREETIKGKRSGAAVHGVSHEEGLY